MELTDDRDAFGHLLRDYLHGEDGLEIVERDDGFVGSAGSPGAYFAPFDAWPAHEQDALSWARGRVLDIGCGAGRHALHLQQLGLDVTGIDPSPGAINVCRQRGLRDARLLDAGCIDTASGPWETLLLVGANLGLLGSREEALTLLARFAEATGPGGRIIGESRDPAATSEPAHMAYQEANRRSGKLPGQLTMRIRYKEVTTPWFSYLFVSKQQLEQLLLGTVWRATAYKDAVAEAGAYIALIEKRLDAHQ